MDQHFKIGLAAASTLLHEAAAFLPAVFASSLSAEDMVLLDMIERQVPEIGVFTIDTGRLPEETHRLLQRARQRYSIPIRVYLPDRTDIEAYVAAHGPNGFYDSIALRQECCHLRKVKPLKRALAGRRAWLTGQRRAQSLTRADLPPREWDGENGLHKFNPLADWSDADVWAYVTEHDVPTNELHAKQFPSIGCAPCTRAVTPGEDTRAGRWWWEEPEHKECGLHPRAVVRG